MKKREMIIKALAGIRCLINRYDYDGMLTDPLLDIDTLAEQAIVIECEVEHWKKSRGVEESHVQIRGKNLEATAHEYLEIWHPGLNLSPGKALAIIVPLEEA